MEGRKKKKQSKSSEVTNFMRMVGNMSTSVDYRVITILDAPGMENGRVTHRGENRTEQQHIQ